MTLYETYNKPLFHAKRGGVCIQSLLKQCYDSDDDESVEPTTRRVVISYVRQRRNDRQQDQQKHRSRQNKFPWQGSHQSAQQARTAQCECRPADGAESGVHDGIAFALGSLRTQSLSFLLFIYLFSPQTISLLWQNFTSITNRFKQSW